MVARLLSNMTADLSRGYQDHLCLHFPDCAHLGHAMCGVLFLAEMLPAALDASSVVSLLPC